MNTYDVSVVVLTYNSDYQKTIKTINSVLNQKNCSFEILIADDGSKNNNFKELENYLKSVNFSDYKLIGDGINRGTYSNLFNALKLAKGKYIKPISPGDYLYNDETLSSLYLYSIKNNAKVSFGDAVYYYQDENLKYYPNRHHPYFLRPYIKQNSKKIRNNYLISRDAILGAALFYEYDSLLEILNILNGKVKYCEDSTINIMAAKNMTISYLNKSVIFYESDSGISANKKGKWYNLIKEDNRIVFQYLLENKLISKAEFYKSFPKNIVQKIILTILLDFFNAFRKKITFFDTKTKKMPADLSEKIYKITELSR